MKQYENYLMLFFAPQIEVNWICQKKISLFKKKREITLTIKSVVGLYGHSIKTGHKLTDFIVFCI